MDAKLFHSLRYKVTKLAPAIFADNMVMLITSQNNVNWMPTFTTDDYYDDFFYNSGIDIVLLVEDIVRPWYETDSYCPDRWLVNEEALRKLLYTFKTKFYKNSDEDAEFDFLTYCASMVYLSLEYYKKGVKSALTIAFLEVYFLACYYSERTNFQCDLISTSDEIL